MADSPSAVTPSSVPKMEYEAKVQADDIQDLLELCEVDLSDAIDIMAKVERIYQVGVLVGERKAAKETE